jgi:hypothetical protein
VRAVFVEVVVVVVVLWADFIEARRAFDNLVELAAVEPDAAALGAIIDFDPPAVSEEEVGGAVGTLHRHSLL